MNESSKMLEQAFCFRIYGFLIKYNELNGLFKYHLQPIFILITLGSYI